MDDKPVPEPSPPRSRNDRLGAALRENLKRRKAQARGRTGAATPPGRRDGDAPSRPGGKADA